MPDTLPHTREMTAAEFLSWHQEQDERYEFVDGAARLKFLHRDGPTMMVGATQAHVLLTANVFAALRARLQGSPCRAVPSDARVVIPRGNFRYPDVTVDCGAYRPKATAFDTPVVVVEVLSRSTHWIDTTRKLEDYKTVSSMQHIVFLSQDEPQGQLWTREDAWGLSNIDGLDAVINLSAVNIVLPVGELYDGLL